MTCYIFFIFNGKEDCLAVKIVIALNCVIYCRKHWAQRLFCDVGILNVLVFQKKHKKQQHTN